MLDKISFHRHFKVNDSDELLINDSGLERCMTAIIGVNCIYLITLLYLCYYTISLFLIVSPGMGQLA